MNSYHFNIYPIDTETPQDCIIHFEDGAYHVLVEGNLIGKMVRDKNAEFGYTTDDNNLSPLVEEIAGHIHESNLRDKFPDILRSVWNVIIKAYFVNPETLLVTVRPDTDLEEFEDVVRDTVYDYVEFDEHLNLIISKDTEDRAIDIQIN